MSTQSQLRRIAALQFSTFAARGLIIPFINIYLVSVGFSGTEIGILTSLTALVTLILIPWLNTVADRNGAHRKLFFTFLSGTGGAAFGLVASTQKVFLGSTALVRSSFDGASAALLSQLTITWLDEHKRAIYGRLRGMGSFGWAVTTFVSGQIVGLGGYPLLFILAAIINLASLPLTRSLPASTNHHHDRQQKSVPRVPEFYPLMLSVFLFFVGLNAVSAFGFIFMRQDLGASDNLIGMAASVAALAEVPPMILIDYLLRRAQVRHTLVVGAAGMAFSWFLFVLIPNAGWIIPLMIYRGTVYTLYNVSITLLVARISRPANVATNQAISQVTVPGLAILLTGPISGWLFDHAGARFLFAAAAMMGILSALVLLYVNRKISREASSTPAEAIATRHA